MSEFVAGFLGAVVGVVISIAAVAIGHAIDDWRHRRRSTRRF